MNSLNRKILIIVSTFLSLLWGCEKVDSVYPPAKVEVVFSPQGVGDQGYNDKVLYGLQKASVKYGFTLAVHIPKDVSQGVSAYENWLDRGLEEEYERSLFIFFGEEYLPVVKAVALPEDSRMDVMMFETSEPVDGVYTFRVSSYAAAYLAGALSVMDYGDDEQHACIIAANPYDENVRTAVDGYSGGFMEAGGDGFDVFYLSEEPYEGYNMQEAVYQKCNEVMGNYTIFFSAAGASNKGLYRYSRENVDFAVGMDDDMSLFSSFLPFSVVKHMDRVVIDVLDGLLSGKDVPYHQEFMYESGYEELVLAPAHSLDHFLDISHISERIVEIEKEYEETDK